MKKIWLGLIALTLLASCSKSDDGVWLGYAEGDYAYIAAPTAGWVTSVTVNRGDWVTGGTALFSLDADSQVAARDSAHAAIALADGQMVAARANLDLTGKELKRQEALLKTSATTRQIYDQAKSAYDAAAAQVSQIEANRDSARAALANAAYQLSQRSVIARTQGRVQDVYYRQGEYAAAQVPVISVLPPENVYVRFFVPESELAKLHLGGKVRISCDGCADIVATVSFISTTYEYAPPVVFSVANRDKLVFKAEARLPGGLKLNPGQPVDVHPL
jgi:HlyD family secretion protein